MDSPTSYRVSRGGATNYSSPSNSCSDSDMEGTRRKLVLAGSFASSHKKTVRSATLVATTTYALIIALSCCSARGAATPSSQLDCAVIRDLINTEFALNQHSSHAGGIAGVTTPITTSLSSSSSPQQNLCVTTSPQNSSSSYSDSGTSCCHVSMVDSLIQTSNILASTFNNSDQFARFKTKMSLYEDVVLNHKGVANIELWNATIDGLKVLRTWGVKYWDPAYLYRNHVLSPECVKRVVQTKVCGACTRAQIVKPCKSLCHNVVIGCIKSPLSEFIESPWKHAVNSVRTAIRLVITTGGDAKQNNQGLQDLVSDLNDWREPITWWIPEYKRTVSCEGLPTSNCWNGGSVGKYEYGTANWKSSFNPEFSPGESGGSMQPSVIVELDKFRNELVFVWKSLEKYWPTTSPSRSSTPPHALALSSSELNSSPVLNSGSSDLFQHEPGSGDNPDDPYESDDEYINSSGNGHVPTDSDDEDLPGYGSGSGDKPIKSDGNEGERDDKSSSRGDADSGPVSLNACPHKFCRWSNQMTIIVLVLVLINFR